MLIICPLFFYLVTWGAAFFWGGVALLECKLKCFFSRRELVWNKILISWFTILLYLWSIIFLLSKHLEAVSVGSRRIHYFVLGKTSRWTRIVLENFPYAVRQLQASSVAFVSLVLCNHPRLLAPTFIEMTPQEQWQNLLVYFRLECTTFELIKGTKSNCVYSATLNISHS